MKVKHYLIRFVLPFVWPLVKLYWRIVKPKTYGVRVLLIHPHDDQKVLLVQHSYGNRSLWNIPGGGYKPKRERPIEAAKREMKEEFGQELVNPQELGLYQTAGEGKQDTVTIIRGSLEGVVFKNLDPEISQVSWETMDSVLTRDDVAKVVKHAVRLILQK